MTKRFIPSVSGTNQIKIYNAETGNLYKVFNVGGKITGQPIITESELYVEVTTTGNKKFIRYYSLPNFTLKKSVNLD